jgi:hypothetical protein
MVGREGRRGDKLWRENCRKMMILCLVLYINWNDFLLCDIIITNQ